VNPPLALIWTFLVSRPRREGIRMMRESFTEVVHMLNDESPFYGMGILVG
jgi:hypothetical protein